MNEYKKLYEICKKIGYKKQWYIFDDEFWLCKNIDWAFINVDVREIIFTQDFITKVQVYIHHTILKTWARENILNHLDDPVDYLYKLLFNEMPK